MKKLVNNFFRENKASDPKTLTIKWRLGIRGLQDFTRVKRRERLPPCDRLRKYIWVRQLFKRSSWHNPPLCDVMMQIGEIFSLNGADETFIG